MYYRVGGFGGFNLGISVKDIFYITSYALRHRFVFFLSIQNGVYLLFLKSYQCYHLQ